MLTTIYHYHSYMIDVIRADAPILDIGTPTEVLTRAGCTLRGKRQQLFLKNAGPLALRVAHRVVAVSSEDLKQVFKQWLALT